MIGHDDELDMMHKGEEISNMTPPPSLTNASECVIIPFRALENKGPKTSQGFPRQIGLKTKTKIKQTHRNGAFDHDTKHMGLPLSVCLAPAHVLQIQLTEVLPRN